MTLTTITLLSIYETGLTSTTPIRHLRRSNEYARTICGKYMPASFKEEADPDLTSQQRLKAATCAQCAIEKVAFEHEQQKVIARLRDWNRGAGR